MILQNENGMQNLINIARRLVEYESFCMDEIVLWTKGVIPNERHNHRNRVETHVLKRFTTVKGYVIADFNTGIVITLDDKMQHLRSYQCFDFGDE